MCRDTERSHTNNHPNNKVTCDDVMSVADDDDRDASLASPLPPEYLEGIALFNRREFHRAHDAWERRWLQLRIEGYASDSGERLFLQALIQAAVAFYHLEHGRTKSAREMYRRAVHKFRRLNANIFMQLDVTEFLAQLDRSLVWLDDDDEQAFFSQSQSVCGETACNLPELPTLRLISLPSQRTANSTDES